MKHGRNRPVVVAAVTVADDATIPAVVAAEEDLAGKFVRLSDRTRDYNSLGPPASWRSNPARAVSVSCTNQALALGRIVDMLQSDDYFPAGMLRAVISAVSFLTSIGFVR
jgi:hypothetical protein